MFSTEEKNDYIRKSLYIAFSKFMFNAIRVPSCSDGTGVIHVQFPNTDCMLWTSARFHPPPSICQNFLPNNILFTFGESLPLPNFLILLGLNKPRKTKYHGISSQILEKYCEGTIQEVKKQLSMTYNTIHIQIATVITGFLLL